MKNEICGSNPKLEAITLRFGWEPFNEVIDIKGKLPTTAVWPFEHTKAMHGVIVPSEIFEAARKLHVMTPNVLAQGREAGLPA